jgi:hypothetical protein
MKAESHLLPVIAPPCKGYFRNYGQAGVRNEVTRSIVIGLLDRGAQQSDRWQQGARRERASGSEQKMTATFVKWLPLRS